MTIIEMRKEILDVLARKYSLTKLKKADDDQISKAGFMMLDHANRTRSVCRKHNYIVTFRQAGKDTLTRIGDGNPCKGASIKDKSIKKKGETWTYTCDSTTLGKLKGLVGHPVSKEDDTLTDVWFYDTETRKKQLKPLAQVREVDNAFTGDYDMHDLLKLSGSKISRILAGTPDESSAIDALNLGMLPAASYSPLNQNRVNASDITRRERVIERMNRHGANSERTFKSAYALVRHGAQTSFVSFLLSHGGVNAIPADVAQQHRYLPKEEAITKIDPNIVVFDNKGYAYILSSFDDVYSFYKSYNLLEQIPFYFFFQDLREKGVDLSSYTQQLNALFGRHRTTLGLE